MPENNSNYNIQQVEADLAALASNIREIYEIDNVMGVSTKPVGDAFQAVYDEELEKHLNMLKQLGVADARYDDMVYGKPAEQSTDEEYQFLEIRGQDNEITTYVLDFDDPSTVTLEMINEALALISEAEGGFGDRPVLFMFHGWTVSKDVILSEDEENMIGAQGASDWFSRTYGHLDDSDQPIVIVIDWDSGALIDTRSWRTESDVTGMDEGRTNAVEAGPMLGQLLNIVSQYELPASEDQRQIFLSSHSLGMRAVLEMLAAKDPNLVIDAYLAIQSAVQEDIIPDDHPIWDSEIVQYLYLTTSEADIANSYLADFVPEDGITEPPMGNQGINSRNLQRRANMSEERYQELYQQALSQAEAARTPRRPQELPYDLEGETERILQGLILNEPVAPGEQPATTIQEIV